MKKMMMRMRYGDKIDGPKIATTKEISISKPFSCSAFNIFLCCLLLLITLVYLTTDLSLNQDHALGAGAKLYRLYANNTWDCPSCGDSGLLLDKAQQCDEEALKIVQIMERSLKLWSHITLEMIEHAFTQTRPFGLLDPDQPQLVRIQIIQDELYVLFEDHSHQDYWRLNGIVRQIAETLRVAKNELRSNQHPDSTSKTHLRALPDVDVVVNLFDHPLSRLPEQIPSQSLKTPGARPMGRKMNVVAPLSLNPHDGKDKISPDMKTQRKKSSAESEFVPKRGKELRKVHDLRNIDEMDKRVSREGKGKISEIETQLELDDGVPLKRNILGSQLSGASPVPVVTAPDLILSTCTHQAHPFTRFMPRPDFSDVLIPYPLLDPPLLHRLSQIYTPWKSRKATLFWRGSPTDGNGQYRSGEWRNHPRASLVSQSGDDSSLIDAGFTSYVQVEKTAIQEMKQDPKFQLKKMLPLVALGKVKYAADLDGNTFSERLPALMSMGAVVFRQHPPIYPTFFEQAMTPSIHFIPLNRNVSDARDKVLWARKHDDLLHSIALTGKKFIATQLSRPRISCYWYRLLWRISQIQSFAPTVHRDSVHVSTDNVYDKHRYFLRDEKRRMQKRTT